MTRSQNDFTAALFDPARPVPQGITTARGAPDDKRFAVYRNNVMVSLSKALTQRFPVTVRLVGEDFFASMVRSFIRQSPPASPLIFAYGDALPDFIAGFAPAAALPYLADVARLEAAWSRAYHAADGSILDITLLAAIAPESLPSLRLAPHPATGLIRSRHAIGTIWQAHQEKVVKVGSVAMPEHVLVTRPAFDVELRIIANTDAVFAAALLAGATMDEALAAAQAIDPQFDFGRCLVGLASSGAFAAFSGDQT